ncbi:MAG: NAD(P)/FAD-dependent oxidoreductase [Spirochaetota bacterium]
MTERRYDALVVGGGSAGMAAAVEIADQGYSVGVVEREDCLGGILNQCIHNGFGLHEHGEDLTGPEYAERAVRRVRETAGVEVFLRTTINESGDTREGLAVYGFSPEHGVIRFDTRALVLAMGCRERNRGNIGIPGSRPAGLFTAGLAQRLVNIDGYVPGRRAVIVGSGDIGLIMARRMTWVGAEVAAVVEIQPYPSGLARNIAQCIDDFGIPLYLSHVVSRIAGKDRVEAVEVTPLKNGVPDPAGTFTIPCDTLLLSVGLIPDNELSKKLGVELSPETGGAVVDADLMSSRQGVFACGNVLHVHDLVDSVSAEARRCGGRVCAYLRGETGGEQGVVQAGANVKYVLPGRFRPGEPSRPESRLRPGGGSRPEEGQVFSLRPLIVKNQARLEVRQGNSTMFSRKLLHVQPSEMVSVSLDLREARADGGPLEFHLR